MLRILVAALMALLVANPLCCCALGCESLLPEQSCCPCPSKDSDDSEGSQHKSCGCLKELGYTLEISGYELQKSLQDVDSEPLLLVKYPDDLRGNFQIRGTVLKWSSGHLARLSLRARLSYRCSYLL